MTMMATPLRSVPGPVEGQTDPLDEDPSFERFFDAERTRLFGALAVMSGNRAEAEEVMQDAFLRVWERWDRVSEMESPEGFLYRTALNVYRKRLRRAAIAVRKATTLLPEHDSLGGVETRDEVARLLRGLTQREREAIEASRYICEPSGSRGCSSLPAQVSRRLARTCRRPGRRGRLPIWVSISSCGWPMA